MKYYNPNNGNAEEWDIKPEGYLTEEEFFALHPNKCFAVVGTNENESVQWRGGYTPTLPNAIEMQTFPVSDKQIAQADGTWGWDLTSLKADKVTELTTARDNEEYDNVTTDKGTFEFDALSQTRPTNAMNSMNDTDTRNWTTVDKVVVVMTKADFKAIFTTAAVRSDNNFAKLNTLKQRVADATTAEEVQAIEW